MVGPSEKRTPEALKLREIVKNLGITDTFLIDAIFAGEKLDQTLDAKIADAIS